MELNKLNTAISLVKPFEPFKLSERCKINTGYICNGDCYFCYFEGSRNKNNNLETIKLQLDIAKLHGMSACDFSGGESTLHKDYIEMIAYAKQIGFKTICTISNGTTFWSKEFLMDARGAGLNDLLFSLHGPKNVQDNIMKIENAYDKIIQSIENAMDLNIRVRVNSVISSETYRTLPEVARILNRYPVFNYNMIMFKYCYDQVGPSLQKTPSHKLTTEYVKKAIDRCINIKYVNARYIPFCMMRGYEQHVVNYHQKKYDPLEWLNTLVYRFHFPEEDIVNMCLDFLKKDKEQENENAIRSIQENSYTKPYDCIRCREFLICDGFEKDYAQAFDVNKEAEPFKNQEKITDSLYYRYNYYKGVYDE